MSAGLQRVRQAVAVFNDRAKLDLARSEIETFAPGSADVTLFASQRSLEDHADLVEIGLAKTPMPIFSTEGKLAEILRLAGAGPGVEITSILESLIPKKQAVFLEEHLSAGKTLLWVGVLDADHEAAVCRTLLKHSPYRVQVHDLRVGATAPPNHRTKST